MLSGQKTYIAGAGLIGYGVWQISEGNFNDGIKSILEGVSIVFLRLGIAKAG